MPQSFLTSVASFGEIPAPRQMLQRPQSSAARKKVLGFLAGKVRGFGISEAFSERPALGGQDLLRY